MIQDPAQTAGSPARGGARFRFSGLRASRASLLALVGLGVVWSAFTACAPSHHSNIQPHSFGLRRIRATGTALARDMALARDLADARACRNLSERLESRLREGVGDFDFDRRKQGDSASRALTQAAGYSLRTQNLVGCRILYRSDLDSAGLPYVISTSVLDSAEAVDVLRSTLQALRNGSRDTSLVDSLISRLPTMMGKQ